MNQRWRGPEFEHEFSRLPNLGYEPAVQSVCVRCLEHGYPTPLVRWHFHEEYELHLIVSTRGKAFIGDYIGHFEPGHLVLTGPRLPHNWISTDVPQGGVALRDIVMQFNDAPLREAAKLFPELHGIPPLLERARYGIEFFGLSERVRERYEHIKSSQGLRRLSEFLDLLGELSACTDTRQLSAVQLQGSEDNAAQEQFNRVIEYIAEHCSEPFSMSDICQLIGMGESQFSRQFRRITGSTFTDFVTRVRINRACQLLMDTDRYITNVCYDAGFHNVANFNRRFRQIKGMTPKEFRRQAEGRLGLPELGSTAR